MADNSPTTEDAESLPSADVLREQMNDAAEMKDAIGADDARIDTFDEGRLVTLLFTNDGKPATTLGDVEAVTSADEMTMFAEADGTFVMQTRTGGRIVLAPESQKGFAEQLVDALDAPAQQALLSRLLDVQGEGDA